MSHPTVDARDSTMTDTQCLACTQTRNTTPQTSSRTLLGHGPELVILHHGEAYRLRETRQGKLILTK